MRAPALRSSALLCVLIGTTAFAHGSGVTGYSGRQGAICTSCHSATGTKPTVTIAGPSSLAAGTMGNYTLTISGGPGVDSGLDVATTLGTLGSGASNEKLSGGELTHTAPQAFSAGKSVWPFKLTAPSSAGTATIYAAGNSTNGSGTSGDYPVGTTFTVTITAAANQAPTIATAASASTASVTAKTVSLSVLGADDGGEAALTYTWSSTGPAAVTFGVNGTNGAKSTTATFSKAGSYSFTATVKDAQGLTATSSVSVTVQQTLSTISVTPASATVATGSSQQFAAVAADQFGASLSASFTWSTSGGGTISSSGLFGANTTGGPFTVTASSGGKTGTATVSVISSNSAPTIATVAAASPATVGATTCSLSVLGADDGGEAALTYTWNATGPAAVSFSANGTNAAKNTTATFARAGSYTFNVTAKDAQGLSASSNVSVTVVATLSSIALSPSSSGVAPNGTQQFTASAVDQFGGATAAAFSWSASGGGTISSSGLFSAGSAPGGPWTVTATSGAKTGTASVTVTMGSAPTIATAAAASPSTVTATTSVLTVLGADDGGEAALSYTWSSSGPAPVAFSANGTHAARSTTATFTQPGSYSFTATIRDAQGLTTSSSVNVTVNSTVKSVSVSPPTAMLVPAATQTFGAAAVDQFGAPISASFNWTVSGGGTISQGGAFTAGLVAGGPYIVTASAGAQSGTATVSISAGSPPRIASAAASSPDVVSGTQASLSVLGADDLGESTLRYTWSSTASSVTFSPNDTNAAKNTVATFTSAGSYDLVVTITNANGLTVSSPVTIAVSATPSTISVSPSDVVMAAGESQQFTASVLDQFNHPAAPTVTWTASGGGAFDASGLFTADAAAEGTFTVMASAGAISATTDVTVTRNAPVSSDTTAPLCSWISPHTGTVIDGIVMMETAASDDVGVTEVRFAIDGVPVGVATTAPFEVPFDSSSLEVGDHVLTAVARDAAGNEGQAGELYVRVAPRTTTPHHVVMEGHGGCSSTGGGALSLLALLAMGALTRRRFR